MDITSYITQLSMNMSRTETLQAVGVAVTKVAMDSQEATAEGLVNLIDAAPSFGHSMDIRA